MLLNRSSMTMPCSSSQSWPSKRCRRRGSFLPLRSCLLWMMTTMTTLLLVAGPRLVQGQTTFSDCVARLTRGDRDNSGDLDDVEFINFLVALSPYSVACPNLANIGDFLEPGKYYLAFQTAACYCLDYDTDSACCDVPTIKTPATAYNDEYIQRVCDRVITVIENECNPTGVPTAAPTQAIVLRPTEAPTTTVPTVVPTGSPIQATPVPTKALPPFSLERYQEPSKDRKGIPRWLKILLPFLGLAFIVIILLLVDYCRKEQRQQRVAAVDNNTSSSSSKSKGVQQAHNDNDSTKGSPDEGLDQTEASEEISIMEEGKNNNMERQRDETKNKSVSWNVELPPPDSPQRMSMFLDSLNLEATAVQGPPPLASVPKSRKKSAQAILANSHKKNAKKKTNKHAMKGSKTPAAADYQDRMKSFFSDSASLSDTSSAALFIDEHDDGDSTEAATEINTSRAKWQALGPSALVPMGAVEVFPLPPAQPPGASSSSSSPESAGERNNNRAEYQLSHPPESESDSVSEVYMSESEGHDNSSSQPDPDGVRLEDGRLYDHEG